MFIIFLLLVSYGISNSQSKKYPVSRFIFELSGSFNDPIMDARGNISDFVNLKNYGTVYGIGFHLNIKLNVNKKSHFIPYVTVGFAQMQNDDNKTAYIDSNNISIFPLQNSQSFNYTDGYSLLLFRDFNIGIGVHYSASTRNSLIPYAGIELNYHNIWGSYIQKTNIAVGPNTNIEKTFNIKPASRLGIAVDAGLDYRINEYLGFVAGTKFQISNLLGKNSERPDSSDSYKIHFLDKENAELNTNLNKSRIFAYMEFYVGFVVFAGSF